MKISIICAMDEKRGIGKDEKIPWHIRDDLIKLRNLTKDHVVVLGRKTYDSMVFYYNRTGRPMPGKLYIVITRDKEYKPARDNAQVAHSLEEGLSFARSHLAKLNVIPNLIGNLDSRFGSTMLTILSLSKDRGNDRKSEEIFIIGGGQIFEQALPLADKLYLTIVQGDYNCDTFFPDYSGFKKVISEESKESEGYKYRFLELER